jgi:hypothetical protein
VIRNTSVIGNAVNQWFPTMMKTRINYTKDVNKGKSIYDYFAKDELLDTFVTYASRHFKRDSFYHYSTPVQIGAIITIGSITNQIKSAKEFIEHFAMLGSDNPIERPLDKTLTATSHDRATAGAFRRQSKVVLNK